MSTRKNFDLERFPENRVSQRMISRVSPIYERSYVAKWLYEVMGREVDDAEIRFSELREQANPETATWALRYWEQRYGIETNENRSLAARRADIIARRGARAPHEPGPCGSDSVRHDRPGPCTLRKTWRPIRSALISRQAANRWTIRPWWTA